MKREKYLKSRIGREFIQNLILIGLLSATADTCSNLRCGGLLKKLQRHLELFLFISHSNNQDIRFQAQNHEVFAQLE